MILRELFVKLGLDVDKQGFAKGQLAANLLAAGIMKAVSVAGELVLAFKENVKEAVDYGDKVTKTSQKLGIATDALQELWHAGEVSGVQAEDLNAALGKLSINLVKASEGSEDAVKAFQGFKLKDTNGKLRTTDDLLADIADKFQEMDDGAEKLALSRRLFGKGGDALIPMLNEGGDKLDEMRAEAAELGLVMDVTVAKKAEELNDNFEILGDTVTGLWRKVTSAAIPGINEIVLKLIKLRKTLGPVLEKYLVKVIKVVTRSVEFLADTLQFLIDNATAVKLILGTSGLIWVMYALANASWTAALTTAKAWAIAAAPFIAIAAAIAALMLIFDDLRVYAKGGDSLFGRLEKHLKKWNEKQDKPWFITALQSFVEYVKDAIRAVKELNDLLSGQSSKPGKAQPLKGNEASPQWKKDRLENLGELNEAEKLQAKLDRRGWLDSRDKMRLKYLKETGRGPRQLPMTGAGPTYYGPEAPPTAKAGPSGTTVVVNAPVTFGDVHAGSGDKQGMMDMVRQFGGVVENVLQGKLTPALVGVLK